MVRMFITFAPGQRKSRCISIQFPWKSREFAMSKDRSPRLREQFRAVMRRGHYSLRTEKTYWYWIVDFIRFHGMRHPSDLGSCGGGGLA